MAAFIDPLQVFCDNLSMLDNNLELITNLSIIVLTNLQDADRFAAALREAYTSFAAFPDRQLHVLYVVDSIAKNDTSHTFLKALGPSLPSMFVKLYRISHDKLRASLAQLAKTWDVFPPDLLETITTAVPAIRVSPTPHPPPPTRLVPVDQSQHQQATSQISHPVHPSHPRCRRCGACFFDAAAHAAWHTRADTLTQGISRVWLCGADEWVAASNIGTVAVFGEEEHPTTTHAGDVVDMTVEDALVAFNEVETSCGLCGEPFQVVSGKDGGCFFRGVVRRLDGTLVHRDCAEA